MADQEDTRAVWNSMAYKMGVVHMTIDGTEVQFGPCLFSKNKDGEVVALRRIGGTGNNADKVQQVKYSDQVETVLAVTKDGALAQVIRELSSDATGNRALFVLVNGPQVRKVYVTNICMHTALMCLAY